VETLTAKDIMTREVLSARETWSVDRLAEFLIEHSISGAPVAAEDGKLIGVVSMTDIVRNRSVPVMEVTGPHEYYQALDRRFAREEISSLRFGSEDRTTVRDIMTPVVFEVGEDAAVRDVADAMIRGRIHRVFVTRERKPLGIISALDVLKVVRGD
jgi:predicted transcriptional regulator